MTDGMTSEQRPRTEPPPGLTTEGVDSRVGGVQAEPDRDYDSLLFDPAWAPDPDPAWAPDPDPAWAPDPDPAFAPPPTPAPPAARVPAHAPPAASPLPPPPAPPLSPPPAAALAPAPPLAPAPAGPPAPEPSPALGRGVDARLARLHLRGGLLSLARAELEQMAGVGTLDRDALADLAEARWRSADLEGAAEAAEAHLAAGGDEPLAHLIAAEAAERQGRMVDARRHATVVQRQVGAGLDRLFAGETRSTVWPMAVSGWMDTAALTPGRWGLLVGGAEVSTPDTTTWVPVPLPEAPATATRGTAGTDPRAPVGGNGSTLLGLPGRGATTEQRVEAGRAAGRELSNVEAELARGEFASAVDRLGLLLRLDPALAPVILSLADRAVTAAGERHPSLSSLHLLRGDAYRSLGREVEAADAFGTALRALSARAISEGTTT
jgi:tetratricopeptide (TPR) repeat protein